MSKQITICSVGDLMICDSPLYASVGMGAKYPQLKGTLFNECSDLFQKADIVVGNFETVVHRPRNRSLKENQMCCEEDVIQDLHKAGFNILHIANNHCLQHGAEGFENTITVCSAYGIQPIGVRDEEPFVKEIEGKKFIFLSLCIHLEWYLPENILYEDRIVKILGDIRQIKEKDKEAFIVVSVHWGDEFATYPSNAQIELAHEFINSGARVVLGHHSHVLQGVEEYKGGIIAYSQGNFISDMIPMITRQTGIIEIHINENNSINWEFIPYIITEGIPVRTEKAEWFDQRQIELKNAIEGKSTDDDYWKMIGKNHAIGHSAFKSFFKKNITKYRLDISLKMLAQFVMRKMKRVIGMSSDGRVSSMDPIIMDAIGKK